MRLKVIGVNSVTSAVNVCETWAVDGLAESGSTGKRLVISWMLSRVTGTGGAYRAAASARPVSPARSSLATLRRFVRQWSSSVLGQW